MDDFLPDTLKNSINEYCQRLITILTPEIFIGFQRILNESYQMCISNNEINKYLMTFQNCIKRIPKYSQTIIENECKRIIEIQNSDLICESRKCEILMKFYILKKEYRCENY